MHRSPAPLLAALAAIALVQTGCGSIPRSTATPPESPPPAVHAPAPPEWKRGDRWVFEWKSGTERGTKTVEVVEARDVNQVRYYVVRLAEFEHFYTVELHWAAAVRDSKVDARMLPPLPWFVWPLEVGRRWTHQGTFEAPSGKASFNDRFAVVGIEAIEVPAGRFETLKVVRETDRRDYDEYWYAPPARWHVRWKGRRGDVEFEERLQTYEPAPRLIPRAGTEAPAR